MQEIKLVTIDIWDTLIRRSCHPDAIKLHLCRYLRISHFKRLKADFRSEDALLRARRESESELGQRAKAQGFDDEYSLLEVYQTWITKTFEDPTSAKYIAEQLREVELAQEYRVTYQDPDILSHLRQYEDIKKVFVSDFYMPAVDLSAILERNGLNTAVPRGYSSCDVKLNKRSGRLFLHVIEQEGVSPGEVMHIGDNAHSDIRMPALHGINVMHYLPQFEHDRRGEKERSFGDFRQIIQDALRGLTADRVNAQTNGMYLAGIENAVLVVGFALYVMEQAIKLGHDRVFFFTREGEFFKQVYDALAAQDPFGIPAPTSELLEVSRISTFSASLQDVSLQSLMRLWSLYSSQSMGALFKSLDVNSELFSAFLPKYSLNLSDDIQYPWLDLRIIALFADAEFVAKLSEQLAGKRASLMGYLVAKRFPLFGKAAVVDIGWRGTIQDNLSYLLPAVHIDGFYLGLDKYINQQPVNVSKFAFGPNLNTGELQHAHLFAKVSPIEMLCNSPNGSVVGYVSSGYVYSAKRLVEESENVSFNDAVVYFQRGVILAAEVLGDVVRRHVVPVQALQDLAIRNWDDIALNPPVVIADAYFRLSHNESFGLGRFEDKTAVIPTSVWVKGFISPAGFKYLVRRLEGTGWPEGYLAKRGLGWFWSFVRFARETKRKFSA